MTPGALSDLVTEALVQIRDRSRFCGVGFVVAPGVVVTNAHVAYTAGADLTVVHRQASYTPRGGVECLPDRPGRAGSWELPDLAFVTIPSLAAAPVLLGPAPDSSSPTLQVATFTLDPVDPGRTRADAEVEFRYLKVAVSGEQWKISAGVVTPGMSGSPVVDREAGVVCGLIKSNAEISSSGAWLPDGGWFVPVDRWWPDRHRATNLASHPYGSQWRRAAAQTVERQADLFGRDAGSEEAPTPASLLAPESALVPFVPRPELDGLVAWCRELRDAEGLVRLVHAPAGHGKTRLALEVCARLRGEGWLAGALAAGVQPRWYNELGAALDRDLRVLVMVDLAEHREGEILDLFQFLWLRRAAGVRVLLLARCDRPWWQGLASRLADTRAAHWALRNARVVALPPTPGSEPLADLAGSAFVAFASRLGLSEPAPPPDLASRTGPTTIVAVHARAAVLAWALAHAQPGPWPADDPMDELCDRELGAWRQALAEYAVDVAVRMPPAAEAALLLPTLVAPGDRRDLAIRLAAALEPICGGVLDGPATARVAQVLSRLYPTRRPHRACDPLVPDRLPEVLLRRLATVLTAADLTEYVAGAVGLSCDDGTAPPDSAVQTCLTLIARARGASELEPPGSHAAYPVLDSALAALLRRYPAATLPALTRVCSGLPRAEPLVSLIVIAARASNTDALAATEPWLTIDHHALAPAAVVVYSRLVEELDDQADEHVLDLRIRRLRNLSLHQFALRALSEARSANRAAIESYRLAVRGSGDPVRPLGAQLYADRAMILGPVDLDGALASGADAIRAYRLLQEHDSAYQGALAAVLHNQSEFLARAGRPHEAAQASQEAVRGYGTTSEPRGRAVAWLGYSRRLADLGRIELALAAANRARDEFRDLFHQHPAQHSTDYARSLLNHAELFIVGDNPAAAVDCVRLAAQIRRSVPVDDAALVRREAALLEHLQSRVGTEP